MIVIQAEITKVVLHRSDSTLLTHWHSQGFHLKCILIQICHLFFLNIYYLYKNNNIVAILLLGEFGGMFLDNFI